MKAYRAFLAAALMVLPCLAHAQSRPTYLGIATDTDRAIAEQNNLQFWLAINAHLKKMRLRMATTSDTMVGTPWANPSGGGYLHFGYEVYSPGAKRVEGDHFAAMLVRYTPGIHVHGYIKLSTTREYVTRSEAQDYIDKALPRDGSIKVYLRGESPTDVEQTTVCRMAAAEYGALRLTPTLEWKDCATIAQIRQGYW
jgi:hypothetical protein